MSKENASATAAAAAAANAEVVEVADEGSDKELDPLTSIWDDDHVQDEGTSYMKCLWCKGVFKRNATKMLYHLLRMTGNHISPCLGAIPVPRRKRYRALYDLKVKKKEAKRAAVAQIDSSIEAAQGAAAAALGTKRQKRSPSASPVQSVVQRRGLL